MNFGVEEEFLVVDPHTRTVVPSAGKIIHRAGAVLGQRVSGEITELQVETRTEPCDSAEQVLAQLVEARAVLGECARAEDLRVVATATPVLAGAVPPPITVGARQDRGTAAFRGLHDEQSICALHVHVDMPDRERAVRISNHLRGYLPLLLTLTANSPYWEGRDTGYASWRSMTWHRWPVAGPPPVFTSAAHYDEVVDTMLAAGALVDAGTIFWDIRPSVRHSTLEVRVADVPITAQESALYAIIVRALVTYAGAAVDRGDEAPLIPAELLRVAYWRAARDGLDGHGVDVHTGRLVAAPALVARLLRTLRPVFEANGEYDTVTGWTRDLLGRGTGASQQRRVGRAGRLTDVIDYLIEHTC